MTHRRQTPSKSVGQLWLAMLTALVLVLPGCGASVDPQVQLWRDKLVADNAIPGEASVSSIRKKLMAEEAPDSVSVVLRGRIYAGPDGLPWENDKAAFILTDATGHDGDKDHDPHTCPFCSRDIQDYLVNVSFRDDSGQTIGIDSRELFDVEEKQTVTIEGVGNMATDGTLEVDAKKIHIRPAS